MRRGGYAPRPGTIPTLPVPDPAGWRSLHLIGVGGAGMRGLALLLLGRGVAVSGSDLKDSEALRGLRAAGARVFAGHRADQVGSPDAVVVSSAIPRTNVELVRARELGIPVIMRAQLLAALMRDRRGVAVAGTHGKTTTTSMISVMFSALGLDPTYVIGGDLNESGSGATAGAGEVFVAEADESDGSFLLLRPEVGVVTNIEQDHLDFYRDQDEIEGAFARFADRSGTVVACWDDPGVRTVMGPGGATIRYGWAEDLEEGIKLNVRVIEADLSLMSSSLVLWVEGSRVELHLRVPGRHNVSNAAAALGVAAAFGLPAAEAARALEAFGGVRRRFERRGSFGGAEFVDDYAHHPTEVGATLATARQWAGRRVVVVFQPHRYTRTERMGRELGQSLSAADLVVVTDVYGAGEDPMPGVTGKLVVDAVAEASPGKRVVYLPRRSDVAPFLASELTEGDLIVTLGAGDITMVADETFERLDPPGERRA